MDARNNEIDFLASVTHDLKSPLNAILCTIDMLKMHIASENLDRDAMLRNLSIAEMAGSDMLALVNNMLTTARMHAGKETADPALLGRAELIERTRNMERTFHNEALGKNIDFSVTIGTLPEYVYWDIQKIRFFAVNNLISNALKFLGHGGTVKVLIDSDADNNVLISVMDDGPGIPVSERAGVFGKFVQASNNARSFQGGGFGLFNAHQTIAMHHGSIEILDGLNGKGVTFQIKLPAIPFEFDEITAIQMAA
ncbi:MAG TPA: HAMP domain-containing sensor histidine kinase [Gallionella sp.]|nr:HAMP domain-containing sensor histidine kinase [Gallionella sp.]